MSKKAPMERLQFKTTTGTVVEIDTVRRMFRVLRLPLQRNETLHLGHGKLSSWIVEKDKPAELTLAKGAHVLRTMKVAEVLHL